MEKPAILIVDALSDRVELARAALVGRYGEHYVIASAGDLGSAHRLVDQLYDRGEHLAACLAPDAPVSTAVEFFEAVRVLFPDARRLLLCDQIESPAARTAMDDALAHQSAVHDWDLPEVQLFPLLDDMLADWQAADRRATGGVRVYGARWSPATHSIKDFLARNQVPYHFLDVDHDAAAQRVVDRVTGGAGHTPVVLLEDGVALIEPTTRDVAEHVGLHTHAERRLYDVVIIGAGPAGLAAGVCAASEGLRVAIVEAEAPGGQAGTSSRIENYLGFPSGISGADLARRATEQAERLGADLIAATAARSIHVAGDSKIVTLEDGEELTCHALILATGMTLRHLPADGVERLTGAGVYYGAAPGEASEFGGRNVAIVGSANSAGQAAVMLSRHAEHVTVLVRGESLEADMSHYLIWQIEAHPNVEVRFHSEVEQAEGDTHLTGVVVRDRATDVTEHLAVEGLFIFIGGKPHSDLVAAVVALDDEGFVLTGEDVVRHGELDRNQWHGRSPTLMETSVPGIFAAGDVRSGVVRRVASAVGQGSVCVSLVWAYLATR